MNRQGVILDSDSESDQPLHSNESESIEYYTASEEGIRFTFEPLRSAVDFVTAEGLDPYGAQSENIAEGPSLHETEPQGRSSPITSENEYCSRDDVIMAERNNLGAKNISGIAKQILKIIMDRQVDYNWMFSNDVATKKEAPPSSEEGKVLYYHFIGHFKGNCSERLVENFCDKLNNLIHAATNREEKFEYVKKRVAFFWKRIICVIETKFEPGEAELSGRLLTEMTKVLEESFDREELSVIVRRIIKSVDTLGSSFECAQIFQKFSLAETTDDADGRSVFCQFIHRLHLGQAEETVGQFCDELHREISEELVPEVTRKRLLVFWNRVFCLIHYNFRSGEAEFSEKLLNEIKKTMIDTFKEGSLLTSVVTKVLQTLETSEQLGRFSEIFCPYRNFICHLAGEERKVRLAYEEVILVLEVYSGQEKVGEFRSQLHESINENVDSEYLRKLCIIFWKRVLSFVDQDSGQEYNNVESKLMGTLGEILKDTFDGEDISDLCANILKNMKACRNQVLLQWLFQSDVVNHKPLCIEDNRLDYFKFIQRLKYTQSKENVQKFCDQLYDIISKDKIPETLHTLLLIFWIRVECLIKDKFPPIRFDFDQSLFPEIFKIMNETFKGDNCLTKYSASHASCNCFCIQCAVWVHEWYYKKLYRDSPWLRKCPLSCVNDCCYIICIVFSIFLFGLVLFGGSIYGFYNYIQ